MKLFAKIWEFVKIHFSSYDLEPRTLVSDQTRDKNDLVQKRLLLNKLNRKVKLSM
jgi:hypothetical protein